MLWPPPIVASWPLASLVPKIGWIPVALALYSNGLQLPPPQPPPTVSKPRFASAKAINEFTVKGVSVASTQFAKGWVNIFVEVPKYLLYITAKGISSYNDNTSIAQAFFGVTKIIFPLMETCKLPSTICNLIIILFFKILN